jgi:hypothetical protein
LEHAAPQLLHMQIPAASSQGPAASSQVGSALLLCAQSLYLCCQCCWPVPLTIRCLACQSRVCSCAPVPKQKCT